MVHVRKNSTEREESEILFLDILEFLPEVQEKE